MALTAVPFFDKDSVFLIEQVIDCTIMFMLLFLTSTFACLFLIEG